MLRPATGRRKSLRCPSDVRSRGSGPGTTPNLNSRYLSGMKNQAPSSMCRRRGGFHEFNARVNVSRQRLWSPATGPAGNCRIGPARSESPPALAAACQRADAALPRSDVMMSWLESGFGVSSVVLRIVGFPRGLARRRAMLLVTWQCSWRWRYIDPRWCSLIYIHSASKAQ